MYCYVYKTNHLSVSGNYYLTKFQPNKLSNNNKTLVLEFSCPTLDPILHLIYVYKILADTYLTNFGLLRIFFPILKFVDKYRTSQNF